MQFDQRFNGQRVEVTKGQRFEISLPENPSTGFRWNMSADGAPICILTKDEFLAVNTQPGSSGNHTWSFEARQVGEFEIELVSLRAWAHQPQPPKIFKIRVSVRA